MIQEVKDMCEQMSLEVYKQKVKECLMKTYNCTTRALSNLMEKYEKILPEYFELKLTPLEMAFAMIMDY